MNPQSLSLSLSSSQGLAPLTFSQQQPNLSELGFDLDSSTQFDLVNYFNKILHCKLTPLYLSLAFITGQLISLCIFHKTYATGALAFW